MTALTDAEPTTTVPTGGNPTSKSKIAYTYLRNSIVNGDLPPGGRIVLSDIAGALSMSVMPVREAVRRLESEGIITFERNVGARVAMLDVEDYIETLQTLSIVEGAAISMAAPLLTSSDISAARALNDRMRAQLDDLDPLTFTALNRQFHLLLATPCPNDFLHETLHRVWKEMGRLRGSTFTALPEQSHVSVNEHDALLDLIEAGASTEVIEQAARAHMWAAMEAVQQAVGRPG